MRPVRRANHHPSPELPLTICQVFYRLVAAHDREKTESAYGKLLNYVDRARRAAYWTKTSGAWSRSA